MEDYVYCPNGQTTDLMSKLFQNFPDLMSFVPDDITSAVESLAIPIEDIEIEAMDFADAVERGLVPPLNEEASRLFSCSERILQNYAQARTLTCADLKALIQDVLRNPEFNAEEVHTNMNQSCQDTITK